jgi:NTP pyrophosphohydrolases containing a Zn-finger, probably nucleic-acid-binding
MCNHFMYHPSFAIPRMNIHGDLSSHHSYLIAQSDGHLIKGTEGFVFHDIPEDIARFESCRIFLGTWNGISWWVIGIRLDLPLQTAYSLLTLREIPNGTNSPISGIACRAVQLVRFDTLTKYCGYCGSRTYIKTDEVAKNLYILQKNRFPKTITGGYRPYY